MNYRKKNYGLLLIAMLLFISIGYALIHTTLKLSGSSKIKEARWNIYFDKVENESGVTSSETKIDSKKTTVSFDIDLEKPGDYYQFNVDTVNDGTIDAIIDSTELTGLSENTSEIIDYTVTYADGSSVNKCDTLNAKARKTLLVKVNHFKDIKEEELLDDAENLKLKFKINYVQTGACSREPILEIDPNGGKYNNTRKVTKQNVTKNTSITIPEAEREGYNFINWQTASGTDLEKDSVTHLTTVNMGTTDQKIIAQWEKAIDPAQIKHTITIDPNGGLYDNSEEIVTYQKKKNEIVEVSTNIEREGYTFTGWVLDPIDSSFVDNTLTVGLTDVTLTAGWKLNEDEVVAKIGNKYYVTLQKAFNAAVTGDKIELLKDIIEVSTNTKEVSLDLGNHTITGTINNSGNLTVDNGKIQNLTPGQAPIVNTGIITIGTNDERVIQNSIILYGKTTGLIQNGQFYFYDGYIEGDIAFKGGYNGCAEGYIVYVDHDNILDCQKAYLTETSLDAVVKVKSYAGEGPQLFIYFKSLGDGIRTTTNDNPDVYALKNFLDSEDIIVEEGQILNINLEGYTVQEGAHITNNGTLSIKDTAQNHGTFRTETYAIVNNGTFNLSNVNVIQSLQNVNTLENYGNMNFSNSTISGTNKYALYNKTTGTLTFTNDTYFASSSGYSFYNDSTEEVTIQGGNFQGIHNKGTSLIVNGSIITAPSGKEAVFNQTGTTTLQNVTVSSSTNNYMIKNYATLYIDSGTYNYSGGTEAIYNSNTLTIRGGTINTLGTTVYLYSGTLTISDGTNLTSTNSYVVYHNGGTTNINGGTLTSTNGICIYEHYGMVYIRGGVLTANREVLDKDDGNAIISGGSLTNSSSSYSAVYVDNGSTTISGGEITSLNNVGVYLNDSDPQTITGGTIKGKTYGVRIDTYSGNVNIGVDDDNVDPNLPDRTPTIIGDTYGLYINSGNVRFYDGIIKGRNSGVYYGSFSETADGTEIIKSTETIDDVLYYTAYLRNKEDFLQVGSSTYNSMRKAIKAISDTGKIIVYRDGIVSSSATVPSSKNITLDLHGNTLGVTITLNNQGTLTIVDDSEDDGTGKKGKMESLGTNLINNQKTLIINEGIFDSKNYSTVYQESSSGTTTINDGTFTSTSGNNLYLYYGSFNILGGTYYSTTSKALYLYNSSGTLKDATITTTNNYAVYGYSGTYTLDNVNIINSEGGIYSDGSSYSHSKFTVKNSYIDVSSKGAYQDDNAGKLVFDNTTIISGGIGIECHSELLITNSNITAETNGLYLLDSAYGDPVVQVKSGTIYGKQRGIYSSYSYSNGYIELTLGDNTDQTIANVNTPVIIGDQYGIQCATNGAIPQIYFYDGIIKSKGTQIDREVTRTPDGYLVVDGVDSSYKTRYLQEQEPFIQVGDDPTNVFNSLPNAITAAGTNGHMKLVGDGIVATTATIGSSQNISLDLNNHTMITKQTITNNGTFTVKDENNTPNGYIKNTSNSYIFINNGTLKIESGNYQSYTKGVVDNKSGSTLNISGGSLVENNGNNSGELIISNYGTMTMTGGSINNTGYLQYAISNYGSMTITGGTLGSSTSSALSYIFIDDAATYSEFGGTASLECDSTGIYGTGSNSKQPTIKVTGGTITTNLNQAIDLYDSKLDMSNGVVKSTAGNGVYLRGSSSSMKAIGGEIIGSNYGIYQTVGTVTLGENNSQINILPTVKGGTYAIYKTGGTTQFYDGILKGKNNDVYSGVINATPASTEIGSGTEIDPDTEETYHTRFLLLQEDFVTNLTTHVDYNNLQTAITAASSGDELELFKSANIYSTLTIPDKTLKIDLNNCNISISDSITNNGTLTIIDENTSGTKGKITGTGSSTLFNNNKSLTMDNISVQNSYSNNYIISNNASSTLSLDGVDISGIYGINNKSNSTLTTNNTNITTTKTLLYDENGASISITGGTMNSTNSNYNTLYVYNSNNTLEDITLRNTNIINGITMSGNIDFKIYNSNTSSIYITSSSSSLTFDGGTVNGIITNNGNMDINDVIINMSGRNALLNYASLDKLVKVYNSTINVNGLYGDSYGGEGAVVNQGNIEFKDTDINLTSTNSNVSKPAFINSGSGKFSYIGGNIYTSSYSYGIKNATSSSANNIITPNSIVVENCATGYGIYNESGLLTILSGTIEARNNTNSYGIYQAGGEVIIGTYDGSGLYSGDVSTTEPYVKGIGTTTGIGAKRTSGVFRFFDGRIEGSTTAKPEAPTQIEPNYIVQTYTSVTTGNEYAILECLSEKSALDVVDWNVKVTDYDIVKSRTFSVDDIPWTDSNNNPIAQLQYGAIGNITIKIDGTSMSSDFKYKISVTMPDGSPITVTNNNHEETMDISTETEKNFTVVLTCSSSTADYTSIDKDVPIVITIEKID